VKDYLQERNIPIDTYDWPDIEQTSQVFELGKPPTYPDIA